MTGTPWIAEPKGNVVYLLRLSGLDGKSHFAARSPRGFQAFAFPSYGYFEVPPDSVGLHGVQNAAYSEFFLTAARLGIDRGGDRFLWQSVAVLAEDCRPDPEITYNPAAVRFHRGWMIASGSLWQVMPVFLRRVFESINRTRGSGAVVEFLREPEAGFLRWYIGHMENLTEGTT